MYERAYSAKANARNEKDDKRKEISQGREKGAERNGRNIQSDFDLGGVGSNEIPSKMAPSLPCTNVGRCVPSGNEFKA